MLVNCKVDLNHVMGGEISFGHCISVYSGALTISYPVPPRCSLSRTKVGRAYHCSPPYNGECEYVCGPLPSPSNTSGRRRAKERGRLLLCIYVK
jgi:hypothetical protein